MILAEIGKFLGNKVATAIIFIAAVAGGIWCYQHPEHVKTFGHGMKMVLFWLVAVAALPWSSYLFMKPMLQFQAKSLSTNGATIMSIALIGAYCLIDIVLAFYWGDWIGSGTFTWIVLFLGFLAAGTYNFIICESLARHADG